MNALNSRQTRYLRGLAHKLKPVVIIGAAGLSEGVIKEIDQSIEHHELIKVKINADDRQSKADIINAISVATGSIAVFCIGHIAVFYRPGKKPRLVLPK